MPERLAQPPVMEIQAALWCAQMKTEIPNWQELFPLAKMVAPVPESIPEFLNMKNGLVKELLFKSTIYWFLVTKQNELYNLPSDDISLSQLYLPTSSIIYVIM